ncbi:MAG TPA: hypothetical protein VGD40_02590 [Chryseosolibacter sp.]
MAKIKKESISDIEARYEKRLRDASNTISFLNASITSIGVLVAILIGAGSFAVYFFGIKPSQDAVDKLEATMDKRIADYIESDRQRSIQYYIDSLASSDIHRQIRSTDYLLSNKATVKLSKEHISSLIEMYDVVNNIEIRNVILEVLYYQGKSPKLDRFFLNVYKDCIAMDGPPSAAEQRVEQYFIAYGTVDEFTRIAEMYIERRGDILTIWNVYNTQISKDKVLAVLNSKSITELIGKSLEKVFLPKRQQQAYGLRFLKDHKEVATSLGINDAEYKKTYYYKEVGFKYTEKKLSD